MITIFYTVVLSVIQGVALNIGVLPFSKGRALPLDAYILQCYLGIMLMTCFLIYVFDP
jgi:hypothetical protein